MKVTTLDEASIRDIGQAFGCYDYGEEHGLIDAFPSRDAAAAFICGYVRMALQGGQGLDKRLDREKKPYIFVGLVCVRQAYQGQGYMRKVMEMAFADGDRLGIPVILETDARSKCDKYLHLGMKLAGTRRFGKHGLLYDLFRYPAAT